MRILSAGVLLCSLAAYSANNDIYVTQSGGSTALTLTIDQIGNSNVAGSAQSRIILSGTAFTMDLDMIGDSNVLAASVLQSNSSSVTYKVTGDSNQGTLAIGSTGDSAGSDFDYTALGDSNVLTYTQGANTTSTSSDADFTVTGTSNNLNVQTDSVGAKNSWVVSGNSNDIDSVQSGSASHSIDFTVTGSSNNIDVNQTDTASTNIANVITTTTGGTIDIDQCASGC